MFVIACFVRLMIIEVHGYNLVSFYSISTCYIIIIELLACDKRSLHLFSDSRRAFLPEEVSYINAMAKDLPRSFSKSQMVAAFKSTEGGVQFLDTLETRLGKGYLKNLPIESHLYSKKCKCRQWETMFSMKFMFFMCKCVSLSLFCLGHVFIVKCTHY